MRRVKICGLTSVDDACLCQEAGADLLGVILARSPRCVDPLQAEAIRRAVPTARLVGVVRDGPAAMIALQAKVAGVDVVQLHGCADPRRWAAVAEACGKPVLPAVTADQASAAMTAAASMPRLPLEGLLLDLPKSGGHEALGGRSGLWAAARQGLEMGLPVMLAGSLFAADLSAVRREVGACDLDVCRGTEQRPGVKNPDLVRGFLTAARIQEVDHAS